MSRQLGVALTARAMLGVAGGTYDKDWQDLLACHRLARLLSRGGTLIEGLVGIALEMSAASADLAYLGNGNLSAKAIRNQLHDLQVLGSLSSIADKFETGERYYYLDWLQQIRSGRNPYGKPNRKPTAEELKALAAIDWGLASRKGTILCDAVAAAVRLQSRTERLKALERIEEGLNVEAKRTANQLQELKSLLSQGTDLFGEPTGNLLVGSLSPTIRTMIDARDRAEQTERNLHIAFALAAYRTDTGRYPAKLDDLTPKYLDKVPDDLFAAKPLVYKPSEKGYLLYSVGVDGKDDGGRTREDDPTGDDLAVRMPLPSLKQKP